MGALSPLDGAAALPALSLGGAPGGAAGLLSPEALSALLTPSGSGFRVDFGAALAAMEGDDALHARRATLAGKAEHKKALAKQGEQDGGAAAAGSGAGWGVAIGGTGQDA